MNDAQLATLTETAIDTACTSSEAIMDLAATGKPMLRSQAARLERCLREALQNLQTIPLN